MNNQLVIISLILLVLVGVLVVIIQSITKTENNTSGYYQGPVRPTDDEQYFRTTGITKPLTVRT